MGRGTGPRLGWLAALVAVLLAASVAHATDPRAAERFRAAAALQERVLYDLAEAEYAAIAQETASDPIADRARLQRGICLFQLTRYADARDVLAQLHAAAPTFSAGEIEQLHAYFGLAAYNLSHSAKGAEREQLLDVAIDSLDKQLSQFPNGSFAERAAFYRAEALYDRGQLDAAVTAYRALLGKYPRHPQRADALYALGVTEQELGQFAEALRSFQNFQTEFPQDPMVADTHLRGCDVLVALAEEQLAGGQPPAARQTIERLLAEYPESAHVPRALLDLARTQLAQAEAQAAEASLDQCLRRCTQREVAVEAHLLRAQVRHARGGFTGGLADATDVLRDNSTRSEALHVRGLCELGLQRPADAVQTLSMVVKNDPHCPTLDRVLYDLAWVYEESNQTKQAAATYAKLVESRPQSALAPECRYRVGEFQYAAGNFPAAAENFQAAVRDAKDAALREKATHKMAWCHFKEHELEVAQTTFERQFAEVPTGPLAADARIMAAECLFQRRQFSQSLQRFTAAVDDQAASESLRGMALIHGAQAAAEAREWPRSLALAERALHEFPTSESALEANCERGTALYELGRLDEAERELTAVSAANQGILNLRAEFVLGQIHVARKQYDDAVRAFFKVAYGHGGPAAPQPYHPWQAEAIYAAAQALEETMRPDAARKLYQEIIDDYPLSERAALARQSLEATVRR